MVNTLSVFIYLYTVWFSHLVLLTCIDRFCRQNSKRTVIVLDQSSIHTSDAIYDKLEDWRQQHIELFWLPSYSPQLNLIEIVWRFMKYEWIELSAYSSWQSLVDYVEKVLREFGDNYVIDFA
ncbi:MAG: transposase [Gloeocapsa sp. UFS-A4-WI-NPMV-4B04]|nr:transposase [Gloeocapsa sp. UFS-A4-WI-NPMV-4B04]